MTEQTLAQRRARNALDRIRAINTNDSEKYLSYVNGLPATILQNGLGQAMAGLLAAAKGKKSDAHHLLYEHMAEWLCNKNSNHPHAPYAGSGETDLMDAIINNDEDAYLRAQAEAMAYLEWLKKFARAILKEEDKQDAASV